MAALYYSDFGPIFYRACGEAVIPMYFGFIFSSPFMALYCSVSGSIFFAPAARQ